MSIKANNEPYTKSTTSSAVYLVHRWILRRITKRNLSHVLSKTAQQEKRWTRCKALRGGCPSSSNWKPWLITWRITPTSCSRKGRSLKFAWGKEGEQLLWSFYKRFCERWWCAWGCGYVNWWDLFGCPFSWRVDSIALAAPPFRHTYISRRTFPQPSSKKQSIIHLDAFANFAALPRFAILNHTRSLGVQRWYLGL